MKCKTRDQCAVVSEVLSNKNLSVKMLSNKKMPTVITSKEVIFSYTDAANESSCVFRFPSIFGALKERKVVTSEP